MIAKVLLGSDFAGLFRYLTGPTKGLREEQIRAQHLVDSNPVAELQAVARLSKRVRKPLMHLIVGWAPDEEPTLEEQFEAGSRLLSRLDLAEHQALFVVHDEPKAGIAPGVSGRHYELHCLVNRVGFDGRVASSSFSFAKVERAAADIAGELKFRRIPGRFNGIDRSESFKSEGRSESVRAETGVNSLAVTVLGNPTMVAALIEARRCDWAALVLAFANHGIRLELGPPARRKDLSRGLVMTDKDGKRIKLSSLDGCGGMKWGAGALAKELGPLPDDAFFAKAVPIKTAALPLVINAHAQFQEARAQAARQRDEARAAHAEQRREVYQVVALERLRLLGLAKRRRKILLDVLGRRSLIRHALNLLLDGRVSKTLESMRAKRDDRLAVLRDQHNAALAPLPRWADWRRRKLDEKAIRDFPRLSSNLHRRASREMPDGRES